MTTETEAPDSIPLTPELVRGGIQYVATSLDQQSGGALALLSSLQNALNQNAKETSHGG